MDKKLSRLTRAVTAVLVAAGASALLEAVPAGAAGGTVTVVASGQTKTLSGASTLCSYASGDLFFQVEGTDQSGKAFGFAGYIKGAPAPGPGHYSFVTTSLVLQEVGGKTIGAGSRDVSGTVTLALVSGNATIIFNNLTMSGGLEISGSVSGPVTVSQPGHNLSTNIYFPLVDGAVWTYKATTGPQAGKTYTTRVVSSQYTTGGRAVNVDYSAGPGTFLTAQYIIESDGSIRVQGYTPPSKLKVSFSGGGSSYFIPSAQRLSTCAPCTFTGSFTATAPGLPVAITEHLKETATAKGTHAVTVPAGTYTALELGITTTVTGGAEGFATTVSATDNVYLVKDVGWVESAAGTASIKVEGQTVSEPGGTEVLASYKS